MYDTQFFILIAISIYFLTLALTINTHNFISALVFKVIPMFSGLALFLMAFKII
jgi:hypothetical protein